MSAGLDRYIALLQRESAQELLLESDRPIRLRVNGVESVVLAQSVRTTHIDGALSAHVPADCSWIMERTGECTFPYTGPAGTVSVHVVRTPAGVSVSVTPAPARPPQAPRLLGRVVDGYHEVHRPIRTVTRPTLAPAPPPAAPPPAVVLLPVQAEPMPVIPVFTATHEIDRILGTVVGCGASDLHLTAELTPRMRKDGDIMAVPGFPDVIGSDTLQRWLMEIAPSKVQESFERLADADFGYAVEGLARFRVNAFKDTRGTGGVIRVIPAKVLSLEQLQVPEAARNLCELHKGLVLVTGPTGSGKSTTLAAMVDHVNATRRDHIITIEDPVEFLHPPKSCLVNQREVHSHTQSFAAALRAALREDPDIVLVGEMRDLETVAIALETAETGHLVFGTLHTNSAVSTVDRIIDQFPADRQAQVRIMLSECLKGVVAQTLCKRIGGGRVAAMEILVGTPAVANLIREGKTYQIPSLMQTGKALGMQTQHEALLQLVRSRQVEPADALNKAIHKPELKAALDALAEAAPARLPTAPGSPAAVARQA